jgi:hypothetical protein
MKRMDKKTRRIIIVAVAVFAIALTSVATFAYWDNLQKTDSDVVIAAGEGVTLQVSNLGQSVGGTLVPSGVILKDGDITEATLSYTVSLDKEFDASKNAIALDVAIANLKIGGIGADSVVEGIDTQALLALINFDYTAQYTMQSGSPTQVTITVTMTEPQTEEYYKLLAGKNISFDVVFSALGA